MITIDDHIGIALAGLTSDARVLRLKKKLILLIIFLYFIFSFLYQKFSKYMQAQALSSRMNMDRPIPIHRLVSDISDSKKLF